MALKAEILADFSGGINLTGAPLNVAPNDLLDCINMHPVASGYLVGRGGQSRYTASGPIDANPVKSLYRFYKQDSSAIQLSTSGTSVHRLNDVTGAATVIDTGYTSGQRFSFVTWTAKDKVYWTNGAEAIKTYDGTTVSALGGSPPVCIQLEMYLDRLYALLSNGVRFSDLNVDNVWQGAALLNISDSRGGTGKFLKTANRVLIAGKSSGLWRLEGSPLLGNAFVEYSNIGCVSGWTADVVTTISGGQVIPVGVAFLGNEGVYVTDGYNVTLITSQLQPSGVPFLARFPNAIGKYYPKKRQYLLSFNTAGGAANTLWVGTNIDVSGSRVAWSQYSGFTADSFSVWNGGDDNGELLAGMSDTGHINRVDTGAQDLGVNYTCTFTSRYLGDPSGNKQVRWIKPVFDATKPVHYQIDYFQKQFASGPASADVPLGQWDVGTWDVGTWGGPSFESSRTSILAGKYGRYYSMKLSNTGDGPNFRFFQLGIESRIKDRRFHDVFTLNQHP